MDVVFAAPSEGSYYYRTPSSSPAFLGRNERSRIGEFEGGFSRDNVDGMALSLEDQIGQLFNDGLDAITHFFGLSRQNRFCTMFSSLDSGRVTRKCNIGMAKMSALLAAPITLGTGITGSLAVYSAIKACEEFSKVSRRSDETASSEEPVENADVPKEQKKADPKDTGSIAKALGYCTSTLIYGAMAVYFLKA